MQQIVVKSDDYNSESQVTKDEWLKILSDNNFMTNNYKYALSIFFLEPEHKATCKFLANKYNTSPFSISGFITGFSRAVQEHLNRFEITTEEGDKTYWLVTMLGTKVSGKLFEWKLRDELVEAMQELDYIDANAIRVDSIGHLVNIINKDVGSLKKDFLTARKELAGNQRVTNSKILFKYDSEVRTWAINEGAGTEVQFHIYLADNKIGYGLGFNTLYVRFKDDKTPIEYIKPYKDAFTALRDSDEITKLVSRGFALNLDEESFQNPVEDEHYLFGRIIELNNEGQLPLVDYYRIINDLKGDLFEAYKKVFEIANKLSLAEEKIVGESAMQIEEPLVTEIMELLETNKNIILTGAPGTGKTYLAKKVAEALEAKFELVQFHPSYDYTDFVEGLRPVQNDNGDVSFKLRDGIFKAFCRKVVSYNKLPTLEDVYSKFIQDLGEKEKSPELQTRTDKNPFKIKYNGNKNFSI